VFLILFEKHLKSRIEDIAHFYDLFQGSSATSPTTGLIFELGMHKLLSEK